ncbi:hypothetical protein Syun_020200 [Stephania yunnanensis]|uniref:Uncharacterized protein n=1 Tax=Stephania yunnanensis TaxID=152371 RepID=A0AAP0IE35_9MAGN
MCVLRNIKRVVVWVNKKKLFSLTFCIVSFSIFYFLILNIDIRADGSILRHVQFEKSKLVRREVLRR